MRRLKGVKCFVMSVLLLLAAKTSHSEEAPLKVLERLSLNPKEISRVLKGDLVTKKLKTHDERDIALLGAMLLDVPSEATVQAARDIKTFKEGKEILALGKFDTFDAQEMKELHIEDDEVADLGDCRVRNCDMKLPGVWIEKLSKEKDRTKRVQLLRALLADYAKDYAMRGKNAVLDYENTKHPVAAQAEFAGILKDSSYLQALAPDFYQYLEEYPEKQPAETENFIYWSNETFGFKPVINLTHVSIYRWSQPELSGYMIASRQIYADHYCDASLGLTILMDRPTRDGQSAGSYLIYINRSRIDMLGGFLSSLRRALTLPRIRSGLERHMKSMKLRVEDKRENRATDSEHTPETSEEKSHHEN